MSAGVETALARLRAAGLTVRLVDGRLSVEPKDGLTRAMDTWLKLHLGEVKEQLRQEQRADAYVVSRPVRSGRKSFSMVDNLIRDEVLGNIRMVDFGVLMFFVFEFERFHERPIPHFDVTILALMRRLHLGRGALMESLDRLVDDHKLIERQEQRDALGHRVTTRYRLRLEGFCADEPQVQKPDVGVPLGPKTVPRGGVPGPETVPGHVENRTWAPLGLSPETGPI